MPITQQIQMAYSVVPTPPANSLWAWYEPSREIGYSNGDPITPLTDQTGNSRNWTQATSGSRPTYDTTDALNTLAVANFTTSRFWNGPDLTGLVASGFGSSKQAHVFIVVKTDADPPPVSADSGLWKISTATDATHYPFTDGNIYDSGLKGTRETVGNPATSLTAWNVYEFHMKASTGAGNTDGDYQFLLNGTSLLGPGNIVQSAPNTAPFLGQNLAGHFFKAKMAGLYLYSALLSGATNPTRAAVISYINTRFALSSS